MTLQSLNSEIPYESLHETLSYAFGKIIENYEMIGANGDSPFFSGEPDKKLRVCRYCGDSSPKTSFSNTGHTISEGSGNKKIITNDECDKCNKKFGDGIEQTFIDYVSFFRTQFGVKGKEGIADTVGENFRFKRIADRKFVLEYTSDNTENTDGPPESITLTPYKKTIPQDIYRALCKYALGLVNNEHLKAFGKTIKWIKGEFDASRLPKVAQAFTFTFFDEHPSIARYIRKNDLKCFPYAVCEFHFVCLTFVFLIPLFNNEENEIHTDEYFDSFWELFQYSKTSHIWQYFDFSGIEAIKIPQTLRFSPARSEG